MRSRDLAQASSLRYLAATIPASRRPTPLFNALFIALALIGLASIALADSSTLSASDQPRVIVTSDGEIDDECSLVRFLLYANEFVVEGIITSSSQYHAHGHNWAGDDWAQPYLEAYAKVYPNLVKHDPRYPKPELLQSRTLLGNVKSEGEMDEVTPGSQRIVEVLLDSSDTRPVWLQAWGGTNTIARALKTIEEQHPEKMAEVAKRIRFYFIWEQDETYQTYIRPHWGKFDIPTIISDQFLAFAYENQRQAVPQEVQHYFSASWMNQHLRDRGPLVALYKAHDDGRFRSEGDSPAFLHVIPNGLRSEVSPHWGGWGGRFVKVRSNTWLDPVAEPGYEYPAGRWYTASAWGRQRVKQEIPNDEALTAYLRPQWRWIGAIQNDFAARADWCVKEFEGANHAPVVSIDAGLSREVTPGEAVKLSAVATDPDGDKLTFRWWQYQEAGSARSRVSFQLANPETERRTDRKLKAYATEASFVVPDEPGKQVHIILEVTDGGTPPLVGYQRVICDIKGD